jgi:hypothetical protein
MVEISDFIKQEHDGFYYEPETGRLFRIEEIQVSREDNDGKVRSNRKFFLGTQRLCTHIIFFIMTGKWPTLIDHKDTNPWNHKWENLREATKEQNRQNSQSIGRWINTELELEIGVEVQPSGNFRVRLKRMHFGTFSSLEEANKVALLARKEIYGEFAYEGEIQE